MRVSELTLQLPWPVLVKEVVVSLNSDKAIQIIAKKCVDDAFPGDYGGRSKWDINRFLPWKELTTNGHLRDHLEAQFSCFYLSLTKWCNVPPHATVFDEVREILRAIFYSHYKNSFQLVAIHDVKNPDSPCLFFRIHPPVRFSPHGSPLLLVSVIDCERLEELISQGKIDRDAFQAEYHRLLTERVSKEVCVIRASTEEVNLLRYVLRINSTTMRRSAWQSKNLPRGDDHPWVATFITPLYKEIVELNCFHFEQKARKLKGLTPNFTLNPLSDADYRKSCAFCFVVKVALKSCSRCHSDFYCSTSCQGNHWPSHKLKCGGGYHSFTLPSGFIFEC